MIGVFLFSSTNHPRKSSIPAESQALARLRDGLHLSCVIHSLLRLSDCMRGRCRHCNARAQLTIGVPPSEQREGCLTKPRRKQCLRGYGISSRVVTAAPTERNQQSVIPQKKPNQKAEVVVGAITERNPRSQRRSQKQSGERDEPPTDLRPRCLGWQVNPPKG